MFIEYATRALTHFRKKKIIQKQRCAQVLNEVS